MQDYTKKWVNLTFLSISVSGAFLVYIFLSQVLGAFGLELKVPNLDFYLRICSASLGLLSFVLLNRHIESSQFMGEVFEEISKMSWPKSNEVYSNTLAVLILVIASGFAFSVLDYCWSQIIKWIL
jgi:preprotein translocase SecE subunit